MSHLAENITITNIEFVPVKPKSGLLGFVGFILNGWLYCASVAVYSRLNGNLRLVYPTVNSNGQQFPTFYPTDREIAQKIEQAVTNKVERLLRLSEPQEEWQ